MELLRQMVNGGWSRLPIPDNAEDTEFRRRYTNTDIPHIKKQKSKKCDQEPIFKKKFVLFAVVQTLRWQRRCCLRTLGVHTNATLR